MMNWSRTEIEQLIDVSVVHTPNTLEDVKRLAAYALERRFCAVHALPTWVAALREMMRGNAYTKVGSSVGFPSGGNTTETKIFEAKQLIANGAQELDMMINVGRLKSGHYDFVENEIRALADITGDMILKVILETFYLSADEIKVACELCIKAGADFVKTGSGWTSTSATFETVSLITSFVGQAIKVKASGGIRNLATLKKMYQMGVCRFGINVEASKSILLESERTQQS